MVGLDANDELLTMLKEDYQTLVTTYRSLRPRLHPSPPAASPAVVAALALRSPE